MIRYDLLSLRRSASRTFVVLIWLHVPVVAGIARSNGMSVWHVTFIMTIAASVATLAVWRDGGGQVARLTVAAALTTAPILMVYAGTGPWQIDWHMYFFVVFGMLVSYVDWAPIALAAGLTAAHHFILDRIFPNAVFPEADLPRVVLHGAIVLVDAVVLLWLVGAMRRLFARIADAHAMLETRIAERTTEVNALNTTLAAKVQELESTFRTLESEAAVREQTARRLDHLVHHDVVTGLPNRVLLIDRLTQAVASAERARTQIVVVSLDLAHFKQINDVHGHAIGDHALGAVAARLASCIRSGDTASRVGGDEFIIVCSAPDGVKETPKLVSRLLAAIGEPLQLGDETLNLGANIGVSLCPTDGVEPEELIRKADAAMYRAKKTGANTFYLYTSEVHEEMLAESQLRHDLERAIAEKQFVVYYQPIVSLTSGLVTGAEALVRWQHPTRGLLPPSEFIGFAEDHNLIGQLGDVVFDQACSQLNRFAEHSRDGFTLAINASALQFSQPGFVTSVVEALERHNIDRECIEIEITESVIMNDASAVIMALHQLEELGVKLSIDDFGTGYSSLAYIKNFPIRTLKIDRAFVIDIASNYTDQAIAATIIALAHNLGMRVIAEGIETGDQLEQIRRLGADDIQGYLVSRPIPADDFVAFTRSHRALTAA